MNLVLTGFMGAGKTTTGRRAATILGMPFVDSDAEIERGRGPIPALFESLGEPSFRRLETSVLERLIGSGPCVLAVGGGAVLSPYNRELLRKQGVIVHLSVSAATVYARVAHRKHRPLLGEIPDVNTIDALLRQRAAAYADNDHCIQADRLSPSAVAREVSRWFEERRKPALYKCRRS